MSVLTKKKKPEEVVAIGKEELEVRCPKCGNPVLYERGFSSDHYSERFLVLCRGCKIQGSSTSATCEDAAELFLKEHCVPGNLQHFQELSDTGTKKRQEFKHFDTVPEGEHCVAMLEFKDTLYVATGKGVYKMVGEKLEAVQFVVKEKG